MLDIYGAETDKALLEAEITHGLKELREKTKDSTWLLVSGGDQNQLRYIFEKKNIINLFNGGVFGSPDKKNEIIKREIKAKNINFPALSLGDSTLDYEVSVENNIDFIFVSSWTELKSYNNYCIKNSIQKISKVYDLLA